MINQVTAEAQRRVKREDMCPRVVYFARGKLRICLLGVEWDEISNEMGADAIPVAYVWHDRIETI